MKRLLITGAEGMLGRALCAAAPAGADVTGIDLADGDLTDAETAFTLITASRPEVVVHTAAWTDVDGCSRDPGRAMKHNAAAVASLVLACREVGARLIYISTDYVFSGEAGRIYNENDPPIPLNSYGASKLAGELFAAELADHVIVRTQWLFGAGRNFIAAIIAAAREGKTLKIVRDEYGAPTYTADLAKALWNLAQAPCSGIFHVTNSGVCSRLELACFALQAAGVPSPEIIPITAEQWDSPTKRPLHAVLGTTRYTNLGFPALRPWQEAVEEYVHSTFLPA